MAISLTILKCLFFPISPGWVYTAFFNFFFLQVWQIFLSTLWCLSPVSQSHLPCWDICLQSLLGGRTVDLTGSKSPLLLWNTCCLQSHLVWAFCGLLTDLTISSPTLKYFLSPVSPGWAYSELLTDFTISLTTLRYLSPVSPALRVQWTVTSLTYHVEILNCLQPHLGCAFSGRWPVSLTTLR